RRTLPRPRARVRARLGSSAGRRRACNSCALPARAVSRRASGATGAPLPRSRRVSGGGSRATSPADASLHARPSEGGDRMAAQAKAKSARGRPQIRAARLSDAKAIAMLVTALGYPTNASDMRERLEALLADATYSTFLAEVAGEVVGMAGVC